jgi:copper resistance protein C
VQVTDAAGTSLGDGAALVDGTNLVQPLIADGGSGAITVVWRAVSSDGHPISGQYAFTVNAPPSPTETATEEPTVSPTPEDTASAPAETETPAPIDGENAANPLPWIIGAIVLLIAIGGGVVAILVRLARRSDDGDEAASDDTAGR